MITVTKADHQRLVNALINDVHRHGGQVIGSKRKYSKRYPLTALVSPAYLDRISGLLDGSMEYAHWINEVASRPDPGISSPTDTTVSVFFRVYYPLWHSQLISHLVLASIIATVVFIAPSIVVYELARTASHNPAKNQPFP